MAEVRDGKVSDGAFFCTTELSTQSKEKWALVWGTLLNRHALNSVGTDARLKIL